MCWVDLVAWEASQVRIMYYSSFPPEFPVENDNIVPLVAIAATKLNDIGEPMIHQR